MATKSKPTPVVERTHTARQVAEMLEAHFAVGHVRHCTTIGGDPNYHVAHVTLENGQQFYVTVEPGRPATTYDE